MSAIHGSLGIDDSKQYLSHSQDGIYDNLIGLDVVNMATSKSTMRETEIVKGKTRPAVAAKPSRSYSASVASSLSSRSSASSSVSAIPTDVTNRSFASSTSGCEFSPLSHLPRVLDQDSQVFVSPMFVKETSPSRAGTSLQELRDSSRQKSPQSHSPHALDQDSQVSPMFMKQTSPQRTGTSIHELRGTSRQKSPSPLDVDLMLEQLESPPPNKSYHRNAKSSEDFRESVGNRWAITDEILISSDRDISRKPVVIGRDLRQAIIQLQSVPTLRWNLGPLFSDDEIVETPSSYGESSVGLLSSVDQEVPSASDSDVQVSTSLQVPCEVYSSKQSDVSRGSTGSDTVFYDSVSSKDITNCISASSVAVDINKNFNDSNRTCESFEDILENISSSEDVRNSEDLSDVKFNTEIALSCNSKTGNVLTNKNTSDVRTVTTTSLINSKSETVSSSLVTTKVKTTIIENEHSYAESVAKSDNYDSPRNHSPHQHVLDKDYNLNFKVQKVRKHELQPQLADFKIESARPSGKASHSANKAAPSKRSEQLKECDVSSVRSESPDSVVERILEAAGANTSAVDENDIVSTVSRNNEVELEESRRNDVISTLERNNDVEWEESRRKTDSMSIHETVIERLTYSGDRSPKILHNNRPIPQKRSPKPPVPARTDKVRKVDSTQEKKRQVNGNYGGQREKSPEEIFEEIVESLNTNMSEDDSVAEFDDKSDAEISTDERRSKGKYQCSTQDYSVENEWGSVYYSKSRLQRVPVTAEEAVEDVKPAALQNADVNGNSEIINNTLDAVVISSNSDAKGNSKFPTTAAATDEVMIVSSTAGAKNISEARTTTTSVEVTETSSKSINSSSLVQDNSDNSRPHIREKWETQTTSGKHSVSSNVSYTHESPKVPQTSNGDIYSEELDLDLEKEFKINSRGLSQDSDRNSYGDINAMLDDGDEIFSNSDTTVIRKSRISAVATSVDSETIVNQKCIEETEERRAKPLRRFSSRNKKNSIDKSPEVVEENVAEIVANMTTENAGSDALNDNGEQNQLKQDVNVTSSTSVAITSSSHVSTTYKSKETLESRLHTIDSEENVTFATNETKQQEASTNSDSSIEAASAISPKIKPEVPLKPTVIRKIKLDQTNNNEEITVNSLGRNLKGMEHRSSSSEEYADSNSSNSTIVRKNSSEEDVSESKHKTDIIQQENETIVAKTEPLVTSAAVKAEPLVPGAVVLSEEVTTQEIVLKIAWPKGRRRMGMPRRPKNNQVAVVQPFRQLHLHRLIRMSQFDQEENDAEDDNDSISNGDKNENSKNQKETEPLEDSRVNGNLSTTESLNILSSQEKIAGRTSPVIVLANLGGSTTEQSTDVHVEYVKQSSSSETERLDDQSAVDVRRNECIKVLRVPAKSVYRVPSLRRVVESVSKVILEESNQLPEDCDVSVTCEAVETRSRAAVEGTSNVTVIHRAILDPRHCSSKSPIPASSPSNV